MGIQNPLWPDCKKLLTKKALVKQMANFDKDNVSAGTLANLRQYTRYYSIEEITKNSTAAGNMAAWVLGIDYYCLRKELSDQPLFEVELEEVDSKLRSCKKVDILELKKVKRVPFLGIFCMQAVALLLRG